MSADYQTMHHLHAVCQQQFLYVGDMLAYGCADHWVSPDEIRRQLEQCGRVIGDCDDFASLAVMLARQQGLPARFVLCMTETDECHLVAEIDGWVIDNRQPDAVRRDDLDYTWLAISGFNAGDSWSAIETIGANTNG